MATDVPDIVDAMYRHAEEYMHAVDWFSSSDSGDGCSSSDDSGANIRCVLL